MSLPSEGELSAHIEALFSAIGAGDVDAVRALATPEGFTSGPFPLEQVVAEVGAGTLLMQGTPMKLTLGARATARGTGFRRDLAPIELWYLFEAGDGAWWCTGVVTAQPDMQRYLLGGSLDDKPARPAPPSVPPPDAELRDVIAGVCEALAAGDPHPAKAMVRPDRWGGTDRSNPARYFKKSQRVVMSARLLRGPFRSGDRAVAQLGLVGDKGGSDQIWVLFERWAPASTDTGRWKGASAQPRRWVWTAVTSSKAGAALVLRGHLEYPSFESLQTDGPASAFVAASLTSDAPPAGDLDAWTRLVAREPGQTVRAGAARVLRPLGRAMVAVEIVAAGKVVDTRWAVLARVDGSWTIHGISFLPIVDALVDGLDVGMPDEEGSVSDDGRSEREVKSHVEKAFLDLLATKGIKPGADGQLDFSQANRAELEGMLPELVGGTFGALFEAVAKGMGEPAAPPVAEEEPVEVPIDLAAERAKRQGRTTTDAERELADKLKGAFGSVVAQAAAERGGDVKIDAGFVKDHGGQLMGALFGALAQAVVPKGATSFKVTVPDEGDEGDEGDDAKGKGKGKGKAKGKAKTKEVGVDLDLGSLFGGLIQQAVKSARDESMKKSAVEEDDDDDGENDEA